MTDGPNTSRTAQTSRSSPEPEKAEPTQFLVRALECDDPTAGASRHVLRGVDEIRVERGSERGHARIRDEGRTVLRLRIPDRKLSSRHARIVREGRTWVLEDLDSTNGSYIDGERITRAEIGDGSVVELGRTLFLMRELTMSRRSALDVVTSLDEAGGLTTLNPALEEAFTRLARVAPSQLPVLLLGETGTGKEVLARALHELSKRPGPFVAVNCGAIPETLVEAQLFGFMKGSFTGALKNELGFVRAAGYGTLFLDEIADLPPASQVALLRVLQSGEVTPVGATQPVHVDVRIVAATHRDIGELMERGLFRKDLYARLAGFVNVILPLRERPEDLGLLIGTLLARHAPEGAVLRIRTNAARALFAHDWPLNVRELEQTLAAAIVLADGGVIALEHLPDSVRISSAEKPPARSESARPVELSAEDREVQAALLAALAETNGNVSETARRMNKARQQIQRWIRRFGVDPTKFRKVE